MPAQFLINITIAFLWTLLMDEEAFYLSTFITGYLIGIGIVLLMQRFFGSQFYLLRVYSAIKLLLIFISELFQSSILILKQILSPKLNIKPGILVAFLIRNNRSFIATGHSVIQDGDRAIVITTRKGLNDIDEILDSHVPAP